MSEKTTRPENVVGPRGGDGPEVRLGVSDSGRCRLRHEHVRFTLCCPAAQAHLLWATADGTPVALSQMRWDGQAWRLDLPLRPGTYRYRYYVSDGRRTVYYAPADADPPAGRITRRDGLDCVFDVAPASFAEPLESSVRSDGDGAGAPRRNTFRLASFLDFPPTLFGALA
jgi:hypothetical protein